MRPEASSRGAAAIRQGKCLVVVAIVAAWSWCISVMPGACGQGGPEVQRAVSKLIVGTKQEPPFAMKDHAGQWTGISIELWRQIADELDLAYEFRELDQQNLLAGLADRSLDVVVSMLTITPERLDQFDFTYPFYTAGLGLAVPVKEKNAWLSVIEQLFSHTVLVIVLIIFSVLFIVGVIVWLFERKLNPEQFGGKARQGVGSGFWFAAVTMTAVGYGDKHPKTLGGRITAFILMFTGVILVSIFTATVTSTLTVTQLETAVHGLEDLKKGVVGTLPFTTSETFLENRGMAFKTYTTIEEGLEALSQGDIEAFFYDAPELRYLIKQRYQGRLEVLPRIYSQENYGIALVDNSPQRKSINQVLLRKIRESEWQETLNRYLGR